MIQGHDYSKKKRKVICPQVWSCSGCSEQTEDGKSLKMHLLEHHHFSEDMAISTVQAHYQKLLRSMQLFYIQLIFSSDTQPSNPSCPEQVEEIRNTTHKQKQLKVDNIINWEMGWNTLRHPLKIRDSTQLQTILDEFGITEAHELQHCLEGDLRKLSECLKPIPSRSFLSLVRLS